MADNDKTKHTPTPWLLSTDSGTIFTKGGEIVCQFWSKQEEDFPNAEANSRFTIRACNNFDSMLQALEAVLADCQNVENGSNLSLEVGRLLRAAINSAKG